MSKLAIDQAVAYNHIGEFLQAERLYYATFLMQPNANHNLGILALAVGEQSGISVTIFQNCFRY
jgi:hypothetical protein